MLLFLMRGIKNESSNLLSQNDDSNKFVFKTKKYAYPTNSTDLYTFIDFRVVISSITKSSCRYNL